MKTQDPTPTRLAQYINTIFENSHGHQRNAILDLVLALISIRSCCQASLARFFDNFESASRRLTRFLHNPRLDVDKMARQTARVLISQLPLIGTLGLSLDWTIEDTQHLLVASLCAGSRAIPLYWRAYEERELKNRRSELERDFTSTLISEVLASVARGRLLITADRGFADVELMNLLDKLRVGFVIRTKGNQKVCFNRQWIKLKEIRLPRASEASKSGTAALLPEQAAPGLCDAEPKER